MLLAPRSNNELDVTKLCALYPQPGVHTALQRMFARMVRRGIVGPLAPQIAAARVRDKWRVGTTTAAGGEGGDAAAGEESKAIASNAAEQMATATLVKGTAGSQVELVTVDTVHAATDGVVDSDGERSIMGVFALQEKAV